jgi:hypothetical protein
MGLRLNTPWRVVSHAGDLMKRQHRLSSRSARRSSLPGYGAENARSSRGRSTPSPSMGVRSAGRVTALASRGVPRRLVPRAHAAPSCDRFGLTKTKKGQGEDPVARLQEAARWSTYTNSWSRLRAPGRPRWVRRIIIAAFVVMAVVGLVVGFIGLLTHHW